MSVPKPLPDVETLRSRFDYDPATGDLKVLRRGEWRLASARPSHKYIRVQVDNLDYYAHRVIWKIQYGADPDFCIDHINGNGRDNRIANLRVATVAQNNANKATSNCLGKGVRFDAKTSKYRASIRINGKRIELGYHATQAEAVSAYRGAATVAFGIFANASVRES